LIVDRIGHPVEQKLPHVQALISQRTPTFTLFAQRDFFVTTAISNRLLPLRWRYASASALARNHRNIQADIGVNSPGLVCPEGALPRTHRSTVRRHDQ
jgi:hypothetical protein